GGAGGARTRAGAKGGRFGERAGTGGNGPLRGRKGETFEGGIRVPAVAWWPGTIPGGRVVADPVSLTDLFPTVAALAGAEPPAGRILDGRDVGDLLRGKPPPGERLLAHYFGYQLQAVRRGRWKLFVPVTQRPDPV